MRRKDTFFLSLFIVSFLISAVVMAGDYLSRNLEKNLGGPPPQYAVENTEPAKQSSERLEIEEGIPSDGINTTEDASSKVTAESVEDATEESVSTQESSEQPERGPLEFETVERDYFDDALFVGDSRTVGIMEYGGLENATFFADSGMSVYGLAFKKINIPDTGKVTFEELLEQKKFGKIYLKIGLNEQGYRFDATEQKYKDTVAKIREMQENAIIYLCANMHVTEEQSEKDNIYNNTKVNQMNAMIAGLADGETIFYIDVNELFDDETGSLSSQYSSDAFHVLGKYYVEWVDWLCSKAIIINYPLAYFFR